MSARIPSGRNRGTVAVAVVIALVLLQLVVVGIVTAGARDHDLTAQRVQSTRAFYAAEAGINMALAEVYNNADRDGDGVIGSLSNNAMLADDPALGASRFFVAPMAAVTGRRFASQGRGGRSVSRCEIAVQDSGAVAEGFQAYAIGVALNNIGGWAPWDDYAGAVAYTTNTIARTGGLSCDVQQPSDNVHLYTPTSGQWTYTAWQYIPSSATGTDTYFILMNTYASNGGKGWSTQLRFDLSSNSVYDNMIGGVTGTVLTLVRDAWTPISVQIDLDAGTQVVTYNGQTLFSASWNRLGGPKALAAVDLYGSTIDHVYYDDIQLAPTAAASTKVTSWSRAAPMP